MAEPFLCGLLFKDPLFIEHETHNHVHYVCNDIGEIAGFHEARHEIADAHAPGNVREQIDATFENKQVY